MNVEKIKRQIKPPCDTRNCPYHAVYEIHVAIFGIKLCKKCMEEFTSQCNKMIS